MEGVEPDVRALCATAAGSFGWWPSAFTLDAFLLGLITFILLAGGACEHRFAWSLVAAVDTSDQT